MTYILIDAANLFWRCRHTVRSDDIDMKIGMSLHVIFSSISKVWRELGGTHLVVTFEGRSWRKEFYSPYKANRKERREALTVEQQEEEDMFFEAFNDFQEFMRDKTNVTVLQSPNCEADDYIARWIQTHPDDKHIIISSDSDFYQLLSDNVQQYNGITRQLITLDGIIDEKGNKVVDNKTGEPKEVGDPKWLLFEKCIRGDTSDNIFSAYPGVRKKGTKNKIGMLDAFADKDTKGFNWNNFMLQKWLDHNDAEHLVLDDYTRNVTLIDLTAQPENIKQELDSNIVEAVQKEPVGQVGIHFMRFCGKYDLIRLSEVANDHIGYLKAKYE